MKIKPGVDIIGLHPCMRRVLKAADSIWSAYGQELVVTSGLDGEHGKWSWHGYGCAVDLRTRYFAGGEIATVADDLRAVLDYPYQVVVKPTHIHVEFEYEAASEMWGTS